MKFPYRVNIFLTWEGAYRIYQGQFPYSDFGTPLGFGFWLIPAMFFKFFGPQLITLVKAQVFLNILAGFSFRKIIQNFNGSYAAVTLSLFVFCISYSFFNFWPWYNHTVIVYQIAGFAFLTSLFKEQKTTKSILTAFFAAFFLTLSFFTKQDAGALGILIAFAILIVHAILYKKPKGILYTTLFLILCFGIVLLSLNKSFFYWFNHGQAPHNSRLSLTDILQEFLLGSQWIKFYLIIVIIFIFTEFKRLSLVNFNYIIFALFTLAILAEAAIFQVTSYVPVGNNIFFHSFSWAFFLVSIERVGLLDLSKKYILVISAALILMFFSDTYWRYLDRLFFKDSKTAGIRTKNGENVVDKSNYVLTTDPGYIPASEWKEGPFYTFEKIKMPESTISGIQRLVKMPEFSINTEPKVLNMTELTPLAHEIGFKLAHGPDQPLWFHLGVGIFNKQVKDIESKIRDNYYDVVLYEYIPHLNNFYPFALRKVLNENYELKDSFLAPRDPTNSTIYVYVKSKK